MLNFVILAAVAVTAYGNICCVPSQFEATQGFLAGSVDDELHTAVTFGTIRLSYDSANQRLRSLSRLTVGNDSREYTVLQLYKQNATYMIEHKVCVKTHIPLPAWKALCIPDNANVTNRYNIGRPTNKISVTEYSFTFNNASIILAVTDKCVPVLETSYGKVNTENHMIFYGVQNFTFGIADPETFDVPAICPPHDNSAKHTRRIRSMMNYVHPLVLK